MNENTGKVWLVGAGPYDAGLLTIKGKRIIESADVVVYDKLVGQGILSLIPQTAQKIDVGKKAGSHPVPQEEINDILLEQALLGKRVVRLKGGDPFVFGRGGEELEKLSKNAIPFEIVPGITSAIAVSAYAGIPVTHRDFCSSLHIITAHKKRGDTGKPDYSTLAKLDGTLIFLMGVSALQEICAELIKAGMDKTMPAAILERGTSAAQRRVIGNLETLTSKAQSAKIQSPAIIVVGKVCTLSKEFEWSEKRSLGTTRVVVTRPKERAGELSNRLRDLGAEVVELPIITTRECKESDSFEAILENIKKYNHIVFTSVVAVDIFFKRLVSQKIDVRNLAGIHFEAVGNATKAEIERHAVLVEYTPTHWTGAALGTLLADKVAKNERVLLLRAKVSSEDLPRILSENSIPFDDIALYETVYNKVCDVQLYNSDMFVFTSASTVHALANSDCALDLSQIKAVCIGEKTAAAANDYCMDVHISEESSIDSLIQKVLQVARK